MTKDFEKKGNSVFRKPPRSFHRREGFPKDSPHPRSEPRRDERKDFRKSPNVPKRDGGWMKRGNVWRTDSGESTKPQNNSWSDENEQLKISATAAVGPGGFTKFGDIPAHQLGRALRSRLYKIANELPTEEHNNLSSRIKYAATTVTASLAAGFGERIFRSSVSRTLESRGALCAIQDHLEHLSDQQLMDQNLYAELKGEVDAVISAVNDYLGNLVKEQNRIRDKTPAD